MTRCCSGSTRVVENYPGVSSWVVLCAECDQTLAVVDCPREEVYAHL